MKKVEYQVSMRMQNDATADVHRVFRWYASDVVVDRVENAIDAVLDRKSTRLNSSHT